ncbi:hypothetical protein [Sneathiella glossodoripedis]|uniref:hypothetical protein n=1 Tax=Sneathiella glossodoripedis TaxID=418853 RepID=UPI00047179E5|nr:hypothetical protein [Sneathiella glossodoripedis]
MISAEEVTGLVENFDPGQVAPAAGPGAGANGGGANFSAYGDDGIGEGIGISGLLDQLILASHPMSQLKIWSRFQDSLNYC